MKFSSLFLPFVYPMLLVLVSNQLQAQKADAKKHIPAFDIRLTDSRHFKAADLQKGLPVLIIYFDPTCEHCRAFTGDILKHYKEFGNTQIVMISYTPLTQVISFSNDFNLFNYPTIKVGTEGETFVVQRYYNVQKFPFVALYGKDGLGVGAFREPTTAAAVLKLLK